MRVVVSSTTRPKRLPGADRRSPGGCPGHALFPRLLWARAPPAPASDTPTFLDHRQFASAPGFSSSGRRSHTGVLPGRVSLSLGAEVWFLSRTEVPPGARRCYGRILAFERSWASFFGTPRFNQTLHLSSLKMPSMARTPLRGRRLQMVLLCRS